jgi:catecholate siderophore receptor
MQNSSRGGRAVNGEASHSGISATLGILPVIALSAGFTEPAFGQTAGVTDLPTITVDGGSGDGTAGTGYKADRLKSPKATAPVVDTPQTVQVIPEDIIKERGASNLTEVLRNTPGISFNAGENGFATSTNNFQLRGFDAAGSIFVDGARDSGSYKRDTFNIERVEVFKGAASDNGRGGPGGYINTVTKTPRLEEFISGEAGLSFDEYGTDPLFRTTLDVNQRVGETAAVRFNALFEDGGVMGRDFARNGAWGIAPSVAIGLGTDFRAILAYEHVERDDRPDWGVPGATIPGTLRYDPITAGAPRDGYYGLITDFDRVVSDALLARLEYDVLPNVTISNQTRFSHVDRTARYTIPGGFAPPSSVNTEDQAYDRTNMSVSNLSNVAAEFDTGRFWHTLSAGLEFTHENSRAGRFGTVLTPGDTDLFNPDPTRRPSAPLVATQTSDITVTTAAAYLYDTVRLSEQWLVSAGLRAEYYDVDLVDSTGGGSFSGDEFTLGGKFGVVYKPRPEGSIYASYGLSHLPPGSYLSNSDISRTGNNAFPGFVPGADPIYSHNYEVGVKWELLGGRLLASAAAFRTEKNNVPWVGRDVGEVVDSLKGYGKQIVQGVELSLAGEVTEQWSVFGGVALIDSERRHSAYLDQIRRNANPADYGAFTSTNGDKLAFTPDVTANLWTTYRINEKLTLGGGIQYVGSSFLGRPDDAIRVIPNGVFGKLPDYVLLNLMASYQVTDNIRLQFNVDNLLDETYAVSTNWNGSRASLGAPRTFRFSTGFRF